MAVEKKKIIKYQDKIWLKMDFIECVCKSQVSISMRSDWTHTHTHKNKTIIF